MTAAHPRYRKSAGFFKIRYDGSIVSTDRKARDSAYTHSISLDSRSYADSDDFRSSYSSSSDSGSSYSSSSDSGSYGGSPTTYSTTPTPYSPTTYPSRAQPPAPAPYYSSFESHPTSSGGCCGCGVSPPGNSSMIKTLYR